MLSRLVAGLGPQEQAPRHAEMADHNLAVIEREEQILASPADGLYEAPFEAAGKISRQGNAQVAAANSDARETVAFE